MKNAARDREREARRRVVQTLSPWRDHTEFVECSRALRSSLPLLNATKLGAPTSPDFDAALAYSILAGGIRTTAIWRRRATRLPHSIETTSKLCDAILLDASNSNLGAPSLSSMYGLALMRGVNGLTDVSNQKGGTASSVSSIAQSLNLPPWLVDLRHDISHNDLPTLPCLRVASLQFLEFLFERFWDVKTEQIGAAVSDVNSLLSQYKSASKRNESTREICKNLASSPRSVVTSCAIKFLVHDGDCSSKASSKQKQPSELYKRGALIPGNPSTILSDEKGFEYILKRYKQILFELQMMEDDFSLLLVVEIIGLIVSVEETGVKDSSAERVLWFALRWAEYFSSREFASSFDSSLAVNSKGVNLREKAQSKWKVEEKQFMSEGIRCRHIRIPFNGILDELEGRGGLLSRKIEQRFRDILGTGRRSFKRKRVDRAAGMEPPTSKNGKEEAEGGEGEHDREITLEEMEAMMCEQQPEPQQPEKPQELHNTKEDEAVIFESVGWEEINEEDYEGVSVNFTKTNRK